MKAEASEPTYRYASREAGDQAGLEEMPAALESAAAPSHECAPAPRARLWLGRALSCAVDPLIVPSFDRMGFRIHALGFGPQDLDVDLSGRRCLVSGANSGIGYETALALADLGAELLLLCRNRERGREAARRIRERTDNARVSTELLDVSDLASVRALAARLGSTTVDVLVHNAGALPDERVETRDGLELTLATHVVGPWLLTHLLRDNLERSAGARVIWISSGGMYTRRLNLEDPNWTQREYDGVIAYAETKRAQVILSELWARELGASGVCVNAMHPGWVDTPSVERSLPRFHRLTRCILRSPTQGADTAVWLAASPRAGRQSGRFFFDRQQRRTHLLPFTRESREDRRALWALCERLASEPQR